MKKNEPDGVFAAMGRATDESLKVASALGTGRLTRHQFGAWYEKRRSEGTGMVVSLREAASALAQPVETALAQGQELLRSAAPRTTARPARRRRRKAK